MRSRPSTIAAVLLFGLLLHLDAHAAYHLEGSPAADTLQQHLEKLAADIDAARADWGLPGAALAVVKDGEVVLAEGFGRRAADSDQPVTPETQFAIGSTTKAFTALGIGLLVEDGLVEWDEPVRTYLPDFRLMDDIATLYATPVDLLTHQTGLATHDLLWYGSGLSRSEMYQRLRYLEPASDFRGGETYNNLIYMTAGVLIEEVSGQSWEDFTRERILEPLGMINANFSVHDMQEQSNHSRPHAVEGGVAKEVPFRELDAVGPAGSINASAMEMTRWLKFLLSEGGIDGEEVASDATIRRLFQPETAGSVSSLGGAIRNNTGALGWGNMMYRGHRMLAHTGGIDGFRAMVAVLPEENIGVVAFANKNGHFPVATTNKAVDAVLGLEPRDWFSELKRERPQRENAAGGAASDGGNILTTNESASPSHAIDDYAGTYVHPGYGVVTVEEKDGGLTATFNALPLTLEHRHFDTFLVRMKDVQGFDTTLQFHLDVEGEVHKLTVPLEPAVDDIGFVRQVDPGLTDTAYLQAFEGAYHISVLNRDITIALDDDRLIMSPGGALEPTRENRFTVQLDGQQVTAMFDVTEEDDVEGFTLDFGRETLEAVRLKK